MIRYKFFKPILVACTASVMTLLAPAVNAQSTELKQVFAQLGATPVVRAQFEQQKKLASLNKTYVSKGTVLFSKNQGVLWQIQSPVKADLSVVVTNGNCDCSHCIYASAACLRACLAEASSSARSTSWARRVTVPGRPASFATSMP